MARPTKYAPKISDSICEKLIGGDSLPTICAPEDMPSKTTVYNWLAEATVESAKPELREFLDRYTRARQLQQDALMDECLDIADDGSNDWYKKQTRDGGNIEAFDKEHVQRSKLRVDTRVILAERLSPKKYRPQSAVDHTVTTTPQIVDDLGGQPACPSSD